MTLFDLIFLASILFILICLISIASSTLRSRTDKLRWWSKLLGAYLALYAVALLSTSLLLPRRIYSPGERRCWDDWCATALRASPANASATLPCSFMSGTRVWLAEIQVSSVAKRIHQRAPDARVELEDQQGTRYPPCAASLPEGSDPPRTLSVPLGPGDSFSVFQTFQLPSSKQPVGIVMHHGDFPGLLIIGADSGFLHRPALQRIVVARQN
jgi:hypothetical protein